MKIFPKTLVAAMIIVATGAAILVGCKKEDKADLLVNQLNEMSGFDASQINDMNAYLFEFKHKMQECKSEELLGLTEAQWHLTALANYDFAYANKKGNSFQIDTIYGRINLTEGMVAMSDLNSFYAQLSESIVTHYHAMTLENKNYRCIYSEFVDNDKNDELQVLTVLVISYDEASKLYYYENEYTFYSMNITYGYPTATQEDPQL